MGIYFVLCCNTALEPLFAQIAPALAAGSPFRLGPAPAPRVPVLLEEFFTFWHLTGPQAHLNFPAEPGSSCWGTVFAN